MKVKVRFWGENHREMPPFGTAYRPHLVVKGTTEYLGVQFTNIDKVSFGEEILSGVELLYDGVDYSALVIGAAFEIREGTHIVGEGVVISS